MKGRLDVIDLIAMPLFLLGGLFGLGLVDMTVGGYSFAEPLISLADGYATISTGSLMALLAFTVVVATNDWRGQGAGWAAVNTVLVVMTYLLILGPGLVPLVELVVSSKNAALGALVFESIAYVAVSYSG